MDRDPDAVLDGRRGPQAVDASGACKVSDRIAELEAGMAGQPLTVLGSARQLTIHPLIAEIRAQQAHKAALMRQLQLPDADEDDVNRRGQSQDRPRP